MVALFRKVVKCITVSDPFIRVYGTNLYAVEEYEKKHARIAASEKSVQSYDKQRRSLSPGALAALKRYQDERDRRGDPGASGTSGAQTS